MNAKLQIQNDGSSTRRSARYLMPMAFAGLGLLLLLAAAARANTPEYEVKATFLLRFTQFVEWPDSAFANADSPIAIGILGDDPFGVLLDQLVQGETVRNRKLILKRSGRVEDLKNCQLLFISKSEKDHSQQILAALGNSSVLSVSEVEGFASRGGVINFYIDQNKVRFEINPDAARDRGIKISSKLLSLGRIVR